MNVKIKSFLYIFSFFSAASLFGQVPSSLVGKTVTYNYQGPDESGTVNFQFLAGNVGWIYDDGGEWESLTYEWSPSTDAAQLKIVFADDEYLVTDMSFRESVLVINSDRGTATFSYFEIEEPGSPPFEEQGTGDFTISTTTQSPL